MKIKIWGARGSIPTPTPPEIIRQKIMAAMLNISTVESEEFHEEILTVLSNIPHLDDTIRRKTLGIYLDSLSPLLVGGAGGNTPCVEIRVGEELFIIDAGSGIRQLGLELMKERWGQGKGVIHLLFSHPHWDHLQGFPFFRPAFVPGNKILIYSVHDIEFALRRQQDFISFPISLDYMQADMEFIRLESGQPLTFGDLTIRHIRNHHPGDAYAFRFEKSNRVFIYASDASYPTGIDLQPYINFFSGADLLIHDAQFTQRESDEKEDWGHSSSFVGVELAQKAQVKTLLLYHFDPTYTDKDLEKILDDTLKFQQNQYPDQTPVKVIVAQENQIFDLTPPEVTQLEQIPGGKSVILKPSGIFDERVAAELRDQLQEIQRANAPPQLIIDMSKVEMLQVTGLRSLVKLRKEELGIPMALAGPNINVQQLIDLAGYADFFAIYPSVHAALASLQARETLNLPGQMIKNRYYIEEKIGDGRLGTVFKATDIRFNRSVALKVLSASFSEGAIALFLQQARQIIELTHPNIVAVYDCDEEHGLSFMIEEYVEGQTLRDLIDDRPEQPFPFDMALGIAENIVRALEYAHSHGVVHGDLKPKNVLMADKIKISDFGLGRLESGKSLLHIDVPLALVTAHYLAPEQVLGHPIDARTDLYALGVILYELFTGHLPFEGSDHEVMEYHRSRSPTPLRDLNPALSPALEHLILKLLDKDPTKRYAKAYQVRRILASMTTITSGLRYEQSFTRQQWPPLVDREEPLRRLMELWTETKQGRGQMAFIIGEGGSGKTRLTQELTRRTGHAALLIGGCPEPGHNRAYQPYIEALKAYLTSAFLAAGSPTDITTDPIRQVIRQMAQFIPEIERLLPLFLEKGETIPDQPGLKPVSMADLMEEATAQRPWLLILDNLHRADLSILKLFHYLGRHCPHMHLMIVGVYRPGELDQNPALSEMLADLDQYPGYSLIELDPLGQGEVQSLLEGIWSQKAPADLETAIYRRSQGNPYYVVELVRGLGDEGVVSLRDDRWHFAPVVEMNLPRDIRETILRRFHHLPKGAQNLLNLASVLGRTFEFEELHKLSDLSEWNVMENLDIALERQFITEVPAERIFRFTHAEIQRVLYESMDPLKRQLIHREAGEALKRHYQTDSEQAAELLAHHFLQAKEIEQGLHYSLQAAHRAEAIYAYQNALDWYNQGLKLLEASEQEDNSARYALLLGRERMYGCLSRHQEQAADLESLQSLAQAADEPDIWATVYNRQARYNRLTSHLAEATSAAEAGLAAARQAAAPLLEGESRLELGHSAVWQGQLETGRQLFQAAYDIFKEAVDINGQALSLGGLVDIYRRGQDYDRAEKLCRQILSMHQVEGNWETYSLGVSNRGLICYEKGDFSEALGDFQQVLEIYRILGNRQGEVIELYHLAAVYTDIGHYKMAQHYLSYAHTVRTGLMNKVNVAIERLIQGRIGLALAEYETARRQINEAVEIFHSVGMPLWETLGWLEMGLIREALADSAQAAEAYTQAHVLQQETDGKTAALDIRAGLARTLASEEQAQQQIQICLEQLQQHGVFGVRYPSRLYLTAHQFLQQLDQKQQAEAILKEGYTLLQKRANEIKATELRPLFLEAVPENLALIERFKHGSSEKTEQAE